MVFNTRILREYTENSEKFGTHLAALTLLSEIGVQSNASSGGIPSGPLLLVANHASVLDSMVLLSQIDRSDYHFIALSTYEIFGAATKAKLLPIYRTRQLNHKLYEYPLCLQTLGHLPKRLDNIEVQARNRQTIEKAASLVDDGHMVSIFPTGSAGKRLQNSTWKAGVGYVAKHITNPQAMVVFAKISGTKKSDLLAFLHPGISKRLFKPQPISIRFGTPLLLKDLINPSDDAKMITRSLEKAYLHFSIVKHAKRSW